MGFLLKSIGCYYQGGASCCVVGFIIAYIDVSILDVSCPYLSPIELIVHSVTVSLVSWSYGMKEPLSGLYGATDCAPYNSIECDDV